MKLQAHGKLPELRARPRDRARAHHLQIFGDVKSADHKVLSEENESRLRHRYAVVVQDLYLVGSRGTQRKTKLRKRQREVGKVRARSKARYHSYG